MREYGCSRHCLGSMTPTQQGAVSLHGFLDRGYSSERGRNVIAHAIEMIPRSAAPEGSGVSCKCEPDAPN
jgi:hypothetical protein